MKVLKSFLLASALVSSSVFANQIEVIQVTEGGVSARQSNDLVLIVQQLQAEVRKLRGQVETQQYELNRLQQQQKEMYSDLDGRLGGGSYLAQNKPASNTSSTVSLKGDEQQDYSAAFAFIKSQDLVKAESAFQGYMKRHPKAKRVSNAIYWLGEVNLAQGKLPDASAYFQRLLTEYPKSAKIPDAMYKLGRAYQRMGEGDNAIVIWEKLIANYPKATAAKLAKSALN